MKSRPILSAVTLLTIGCVASLPAEDEKPPAKPAAKAGPAPLGRDAARAAAAEKHAARAIAAEKAAADERDVMAQQYEQYMHPRMWRELEFIRQSCNLTAEQRPLVKAAGLASAKGAAKQFLRNQQQGGTNDLGVFIRKEIFKTLEKTLTPDQMAQYQQGSERRAASIKNAIILNTVARLDGLLYLSSEQRDQITESLTKNWDNDWEIWQGVSVYGGLYFPMIPDQHLVPHLNEQQKKVWQGARKINPNFLNGAGMRQEADDEWWNGKEETDETKAGASGESPEPVKKETLKS